MGEGYRDAQVIVRFRVRVAGDWTDERSKYLGEVAELKNSGNCRIPCTEVKNRLH